MLRTSIWEADHKSKASHLSYRATIWHYAAPTLLHHLTARESCWNTMNCCQLWEDKQKNQEMLQVTLKFLRQKNPYRCFYVRQSIQMIPQTILISSKQGQTPHLKIQHQQQIVSNVDINEVPQLGSHFIHWELCFCNANFTQHLLPIPGPYCCLLAEGLDNLFWNCNISCL